MTQVLQYRFGAAVGENGRSELQGHAFGNLLLAALTGITGSFDEALLAAERVLALRGRVLPSTLADVTLEADVQLPNGDIQRVVGESAIPEVNGRIQRVNLQPHNVKAYPAALQAIFQADLIVMGPGSLYTSILPNLLVPDLAEALLQPTRLRFIYVTLPHSPERRIITVWPIMWRHFSNIFPLAAWIWSSLMTTYPFPPPREAATQFTCSLLHRKICR